LGLSSFQHPANGQNPEDGSPVVVFFGDSRAAQWPAPQLKEFSFINRGIGNQTSAQVVSRFAAHVTPLQPEVVILQVGINDLKTLPLFPDRKREIVANCKANIQTMIEDSLTLGSTVVVTTIFPTGDIPLHRRLVWSDEIDQAIEEINHYIRTLGQDRVIVFDAAEILSDTRGQLRREYRLDELHLNEAGYEALNLELTPILHRPE
jgi:lysophospholipase L1-like esterase